MICKYEITIVAACPTDSKPDIYEATFISDKVIMCEAILDAIKPYATEKIYQERLTAELARELKCRVSTVGHHSGVKTTVDAP